jgi:hypothetical protein
MTIKVNSPYPYLGINGQYLSRDFLDSVWADLHNKAIICDANISEPSPSEKLAYFVMKQITMGNVNPDRCSDLD